MNAKILVGGVAGVGLLVVAGVLIFGTGPGGTKVTPVSGLAVESEATEYESNAYALPEVEVSHEPEVVVRDLQPARGDRRGGRGGGDRFARMEERMMQYDVDGDGMLNADERDAMVASFRQRMTERFDANEDGVVSIEEQFAGRREFMMDSPRGDRMRDEFDVDGDGELNEQEQAAMNAELDSRDADRIAELTAQYDLDGDGEMSMEETLAMQDQQVADRRARMDQFTVQFDSDGDGNLNADERVDIRDSMIERRELESFLRRFDTNGDREIGPIDFERFTDSYGKKEPHADANRDGIINVDDLVMFRDMAEKTLLHDD